MAQFADILPNDGDVLGRILNALYWDLAVPSDYLSVKVEKGWVTISGDVARSYEKSCAEAGRPPGFRRQGRVERDRDQSEWERRHGRPHWNGRCGGAGGSQ